MTKNKLKSHFILGTAGHIDHGKTSLIKALTGIECDTHKEEKKRGITINLGFAHIELPSGEKLGVVDVPGHKDFINVMVAGASGIDIALLVIAADSGVMPQTIEHLRIMNILGVSHGLIALTKEDLADEEIKELAIDEIEDFVKGTFLEGKPIVPVSSLTGSGLDELRREIDNQLKLYEKKKQGDFFRLYIDRIFTKPGFGTIVTGSVLNGYISVSDTLYLLPSMKEVKIRRLERHGAETNEIVTGDRASINLSGLGREDCRKGMALCSLKMEPVSLIDVKLELFENSGHITGKTRVMLLSGTQVSQARLSLLEGDDMGEGEPGFAQLQLEKPLCLANRDRFIIRNTSGNTTLGGGIILDSSPLFHRKKTQKLIENLKNIESGNLQGLIENEVLKANSIISINEVAERLLVSYEELDKALDEVNEAIISRMSSKDKTYLLPRRISDYIIMESPQLIRKHCLSNPLDVRGLSASEVLDKLNVKKNAAYIEILSGLFGELTSLGELIDTGKRWIWAKEKRELTPKTRHLIEQISKTAHASGLKALTYKEICAITGEHENNPMMGKILTYLEDTGELYHIEEQYLHSSTVNSAREKILEFFRKNEGGIALSDFRDLINGNRKTCLLLMNQFDKEGLTRRKGDIRVFTGKGMN